MEEIFQLPENSEITIIKRFHSDENNIRSKFWKRFEICYFRSIKKCFIIDMSETVVLKIILKKGQLTNNFQTNCFFEGFLVQKLE